MNTPDTYDYLESPEKGFFCFIRIFLYKSIFVLKYKSQKMRTAATEMAVDVLGKTVSGGQWQGRGSRMRHSRICSCSSFGFSEKHL